MGICTVFCFFGVLQLVLNGTALRVHSPSNDPTNARQRIASSTGSTAGTASTESGVSKVTKGQAIGFTLVALALVAQSIARTVAAGLWPLFLNKHLGWESMEYGEQHRLVCVAAVAWSTVSSIA
jgi:hypothetical protein